MSDELNAAMNKIKQVLNHYRAFQEIEKALQVASESERMVVELGLQADALKSEIARLESAKAEALATFKEVVAKSERDLADRVSKMISAEEEVRKEVKAVEGDLAALRERAAEMEKNYARRSAELSANIQNLHIEAEAAEERYRQAVDSIKALKAGL